MTFSQILGHDQQKNILRRALESNRLAHAYLFHGPEGVGKRLMALALVRGIFCQEGTGCGNCIACRKVDHQNHPDLHLLEADGAYIKIEQVRALQKELAFHPLESPQKVCLIDGADKLNPAGGNALLKTLEEPNGNTLFVLLSAHTERILPTIRSRCQSLPFGRIPPRILRSTLEDRLGLSEEEAHLLSALSDGSFKKALGRDRELFLERRRPLLKSLTALSSGSILPLFEMAEELSADKDHIADILEIYQAFFRDLLLHHHGRPVEELVNIDLQEKISRVSGRETIRSLMDKLDAIGYCRRQLDRNVNRQLALEVLLMRLAA